MLGVLGDCDRFSDVGGDLTCTSFGSSWSLSAFSNIMVGETVLFDLVSDDWLIRPKGPSLPIASGVLVFRKFHFLRSAGRINFCVPFV